MTELTGWERPDATRREFLRRLGVTGLVVAGTSALPATSAAAAGVVAGATVLSHATVIDATGAPPQHDMSVVLAGDRIVAVVPSLNIGPVPGGRVVDVRGKFVVPGLWDMHVHTTVGLESIYLPLYIVNGVTGIREMWGFPRHHELRSQIICGELLGPRWEIGSTIIDGAQSWDGVIIVHNEDEARQAVHTTKYEEHADFVKSYSYLTREAYFAIADESRRLGIRYAGHLPDLVSAVEASDAGQYSFEHLRDMFICLSDQEAELRAQIAALPFGPAAPRNFRKLVDELDRQALATYSQRRAEVVFDRLARNRTRHCATLTVLRLFSEPAEFFANDPRLKYLPPSLVASWKQKIDRFSPPPEQLPAARQFFQARLRLVHDMHRAGVGILAGTDVSNPYCMPGFSLHDELGLLVRGGLTPMQALQTATLDAARYLGMEQSTGTVTAGKSADLVVLNANPLDDITNTQRIHAVVVGGRLITSVERERMLSDLETAANSPALAAASLVMAACPC
ncbi:MAG TPA: amidohydrolase family protein [Pseudonocardiaceae bacterium]|nr:amidohydrolase family protein [Pseudonocardiaceae bacterium]